jgi:hypothetical protein
VASELPGTDGVTSTAPTSPAAARKVANGRLGRES